MTDLHYGVNVETLLYDLSQHDSENIGEFEVYGEDESGREGSASVDITLLAADALTLITSLKEQLKHKDAALNTARADAIRGALKACQHRCDTDCVMDAHGISYESAELRVAGAVALHDELAAYASNLQASAPVATIRAND